MCAAILLLAQLLAAVQPSERIADIQVHGNALTTETAIIELAGLSIGMPVDAATVDEAAERLRRSGKFERVEVLKRYASIADPAQISLVILVDEGPLTIQTDGSLTPDRENPPTARIRRRTGPNLMYLPILKFEDGYGFSYGVRFSAPDALGKGNRVSFPGTWGADKRAAAVVDRELTSVRSRVQAGGEFARRQNPFYHEDDDRGRFWVRGEHDLARPLRAGAAGEWQHVSFGNDTDRFVQASVDLTLDTRVDPSLGRNAVYARAEWDHLNFANAPDANRTNVDLRGYLGLFGQHVLVIRGLRRDADEPLPQYLQPLLGGIDNLRGFRAGSAVGDTLVATSAEVRLPVTSPFSVGKAGFTAFFDVAAVYGEGQRVFDSRFSRGVGGGLWLSAAVVRFDAYVGHGLGGSTRAHFATAILF